MIADTAPPGRDEENEACVLHAWALAHITEARKQLEAAMQLSLAAAQRWAIAIKTRRSPPTEEELKEAEARLRVPKPRIVVPGRGLD